jgi:8-amino-7-oxononanoate synthase
VTTARVDPLAWLADAARSRTAAGLRRRLRPRELGDDVLDLAGNDYLGLSMHPAVIEAGVAALRAWGAGSTGSRLVTGTTSLHAELDAALAGFVGTEAALVCATGYAANLAAVTALSGPGSLIVSDAANHASLVDACRLSRARVAVVPHGDHDAVADALASRAEVRALVVTDTLFSVDGDVCDFAALHAVSRRYGAVLVGDEAHALGVVGTGRGVAATCGLAGEPDVVLTSSLSKSLGSQGGVVLGPAAVTAQLVDVGRTVIFDTGLAPAAVGAALAALSLLTADPGLATRARARAADVAAIVGVPRGPGTVVPVVLGDPDRAVAAQAALAEHGVRVGCFRPPSVPHGRSALRLSARANLTDADLDRLREAWQVAIPADRAAATAT